MTRRIGLANLLMAGLLIGIVQCKRSSEKSTTTTPAARDTTQDASEPLSTETRVATDSLEDTYWQLSRLRDKPVPTASGQREPHLIFNSLNRRVGGSGGCNHLGASYALSGDQLSLDSITTTLMACAEGMDTEKAFLEALQKVSKWRISGQQLELLDESGRLVARFEARKQE